MAYFNEENTVEQMLINAAGKCGWIYVEPQEVPRLPDEVLVTEWLVTALRRLNPITEDQAAQVVYRLRAACSIGTNYEELINANDRFRRLLFEENSYPFGEDGENINIRFFSDKPAENRCVVTNQWEFPRKSKEGGKRLDLVYILNSAAFFLVRKFYMLRCLFGTLYVDMRCFGVSCFFSKHKIPHPNQWGILKSQRSDVYSRKTSE